MTSPEFMEGTTVALDIPSPPLDATYTKYYCEENIYLLAQSFLARLEVTDVWEINVVFISNRTRTVALWGQRAAKGQDIPVVWDYHVILTLRARHGYSELQRSRGSAQEHQAQSIVYDFDTTSDVPCSSYLYMKTTFPYIPDHLALNAMYHSNFRIVAASEFVDNFASDRSHMIVPSNQINGEGVLYVSPLPPYAPIQGPLSKRMGITHNIMTDFVDMNSRKFGVVLNAQEFAEWCAASPPFSLT